MATLSREVVVVVGVWRERVNERARGKEERWTKRSVRKRVGDTAKHKKKKKKENVGGGVNERRPFLPFLIYTSTPLCRPYKRKISFQKFL